MPAFLEHTETGQRWRLRATRDNLLGRKDEADVFLSHESVTRGHTIVRRDAEGWQAVDLGSTNGTGWMAGGEGGWRRIARQRLSSGDLLRVGLVSLRFLDDGIDGADETSVEELYASLRQRFERGDDPRAAGWLVPRIAARGGDLAEAFALARAARRSPRPELRRTALFTFSALYRSERASPARDDLDPFFSDPDPVVRLDAVGWLTRLLEAPRERLVQALADPDRRVFEAAVRALIMGRAEVGATIEDIVRHAPADRRQAVEQYVALHFPSALAPR